MKSIWKFELPNKPHEPFEISMPFCSEILDVQLQHKTGQPVMWARVDMAEGKCSRRFIALWTGQELKESWDNSFYIGTYQTANGLVWHLFELFEEGL